jgi:ferredoxin-NADP reductase
MPLESLDTTLVSIHAVTPRVKQFLLRADDHTFDFTPGQHVSVEFKDEEGTRRYRPYSPVSQPGTDTVALAVKRYAEGACSSWLHEQTIGATIPLTLPSGNLVLQDRDRDVTFLATGTGLTPMLSMLTRYLAEGEGHALLLFGERAQEDLMYRETLDRLSASHARLTVDYVLSGERWTGPQGYVQEHISAYVRDAAVTDFYVCGVPEMVVETKAVLRDLGASDERIFTEGWEDGAVDE